MNREILFRGKDTIYRKWIYGDLLTCASCTQIWQDSDSGKFPASVIPETVGQYTGLTDKGGKRIFEGDIIEAHFDELFPNLAATLIVVWSDYGWFGRDMEGNVDSLERKWVSDFFEIIGNIHDNPDLLEVSDDNGQ